MVLEMLADTRKVDNRLNAGGFDNSLGTNTTQLQNLRATDCATGKDNLTVDGDVVSLAAGLCHELDGLRLRERTARVVDDVADCRAAEDVEVATRSKMVEICGTRVRACPVRGVDRGSRDVGTSVLTAVCIGRHLNAHGAKGRNPFAIEGGHAV